MIFDYFFGKKKYVVLGPFLDDGILNIHGVFSTQKEALDEADRLNKKHGSYIFDVKYKRVWKNIPTHKQQPETPENQSCPDSTKLSDEQVCEYCNTPAKKNDVSCRACGGPLSAAQQHVHATGETRA